MKLDRPELNDILAKAQQKLKGIPAVDRKRYAFLHSPDCDYSDLIEVPLPSFWSEELGKIHGRVESLSEGETLPKQLSKEEKIARAKELAELGYRIMKMLDVSRTSVYRYVNLY